MRLTSKAPLLRLAPLLLLSLAPSRSTDDVAKSSSPADSRYFQMALFTYEFMQGGVNWLDGAGYVDIPVFEGSFDSSHQPAGPSIIRLPTWLDTRPLASVNVDWSRVLAVVIDEPFATTVANYSDPSTVGAECTRQNTGIAERRGKLMAAATICSIGNITMFPLSFRLYPASKRPALMKLSRRASPSAAFLIAAFSAPFGMMWCALCQ